MIPSYFVFCEQFTLNANGKLDKKSLPEITKSKGSDEFEFPLPGFEEELAKIWTRILNIKEINSIGRSDDFFQLGGHSLLVPVLIFEIKELFQVSLPLKELFNFPQLKDLSDVIFKYSKDKVESEQLDIDWEKEIELPNDILPILENAKSLPHSDLSKEGFNIFLTGATGLLGLFLLRYLILSSTSRVYCLVRSRGKATAHDRLIQSLKDFRQWQDVSQLFESRVVVVDGDLSLVNFGLSEENFVKLAKDVDMIYHNGAMISGLQPYEHLKLHNVNATLEVIKLATIDHVKPIIYVSTFSVFPDKFEFSEKDECAIPNPAEVLSKLLPYGASKLVGEIMLQEADKICDIKVSYFRLGFISGDTVTGSLARDQILSRYIRTIMLNKLAPDSDDDIYMTPVDFCAKLVCTMGHLFGNYFHVITTKKVLVNNLTNMIEQKLNMSNSEEIIKVRRIETMKWRDLILQSSKVDASHPLLLPELLKTKDEDYEDDSKYDPYKNAHTLEQMKILGLEYPEMHDAIILRYLDFLEDGSH
jgi:thioester reductase-like protein